MDYNSFSQQLIAQGFCRVEKDDRLLDILPDQTRAKGLELWDQWETDAITIIRLRLPYYPSQTQTFTIPRLKLEQALQRNQKLNLSDFSAPTASVNPDH